MAFAMLFKLAMNALTIRYYNKYSKDYEFQSESERKFKYC